MVGGLANHRLYKVYPLWENQSKPWQDHRILALLLPGILSPSINDFSPHHDFI